jgi:hypothetical protein
MTTTEKFQKLPDFFSSKKECKEYKNFVTNPRYSNFKQLYFTAGDFEQFYSYKDETNGSNPDPNIDFVQNVWHNLSQKIKEEGKDDKIKDVVENTDWEKYKNITSDSVDNTFKYIFDKFKKGVFIKIKNNNLSVFLPFSKHDYTNEWHDRIKTNPEYGDVVSFLQYASKLAGYDVPRDKINRYVNTWYGNNCLIRSEYPIGENDRGLSNLKDMLITLCKERVIPDIELFINKRDFPIITKNDYEPYEQIYDMENYRLVSHKYNKYCPILSMVTTNKHSDIPMPTHEDWARVSSQDGKLFGPDCRDYRCDFSKPWTDRIPTAVFRGASTGCGVTVETNQRLNLSYLSSVSPVEDGYKLLDAGITKWNLRPRKVMGNIYLQLIVPQTLPFWNKETNGLVGSLSPEEQANYKYIINVDGHVNAFRLSLELSMGCVVLLADSKYRTWYRRYLIPYVHYVPIKEDLSDIFDKIRWCRENDDKCEIISINAKKFYDTYLSKNGILDYLQYLFFRIKKSSGIYLYNNIKVEDIITNQQLSILDNYGFLHKNFPSFKKEIINYPFSTEDSNYYSRDGLRLFLGSIDIDDEEKDIFKDCTIVHQSRDTVVYRKIVNENLSFIIKNIKTEDRKIQLINEAFCGITEINKLIKDIPNFRMTYGISSDKTLLVSEYVEGKTLKEYIMDGCSVSELKQIFIMLTLAIQVAQERCGFVHYDLYPWNVIINKLKSKQKITYQLDTDIIVIETDIIPVIVDYGRSHVIHDKNHYGTIEPFKTSRIQDCFCMLISCIYDMATQQKEKSILSKELNTVLYILNFYSQTNLQKTKLEKYPDMMQFLSKNKKYNEMIFGDKCDLEKTKTPNELFIYLMNCPYSETKKIINVIQYSYPKKIEYPFITSHNSFYYSVISNQNPYKSMYMYIDKLSNYYESLMSAASNKLVYINVCNSVSDAVVGVLDFIKVLEKINYKEPVKEDVGKEKDFFLLKDQLKRFCKTILERIALKFAISYGDKKDKEQEFKDNKTEKLIFPYFTTNTDFFVAKYTPKTFSIPEEILSILQGNMINNIKKKEKENDYLLSIREMMVSNFFYYRRYRLDEDDEFDIIKNNKKLMKISNLVCNNYYANIKTLINLSKVLYNQEIVILSSMDQKPTKIISSINNLLSLIK